jgi:hypothetical protein
MISIKDAVIVWNYEKDDIEVQPLLFYKKNPRTSTYSWGGCNSEIWKQEDFEKRKALVFINAIHFIIAYKISPEAVHNALLEIEEYYDGCNEEIDH